MQRLLLIFMVLVASCAGPGLDTAALERRVDNAQRRVESLIDLATRENPDLVADLQKVDELLALVKSAAAGAQDAGPALALVNAAIEARPGGSLELGLIALAALLEEIAVARAEVAP